GAGRGGGGRGCGGGGGVSGGGPGCSRMAWSAPRWSTLSSPSRMPPGSSPAIAASARQPQADRGQEATRVHRLGEVVGCARLDALLAVPLHRLGRQRDDREVAE